MRMELRRLGDENQKLKARVDSRAMVEWDGGRSQFNERCQCVCRGRGCQSRVFDGARRGRSPERKFQHCDERTSGMDVRGYKDSHSPLSPARRSPSPGACRWNGYEDDLRKQGVRFMSPNGEEYRYQTEN